jgi:hypothetical protein
LELLPVDGEVSDGGAAMVGDDERAFLRIVSHISDLLMLERDDMRHGYRTPFSRKLIVAFYAMRGRERDRTGERAVGRVRIDLFCKKVLVNGKKELYEYNSNKK